ncbi:MAG: TIGR00645 family protein [Prochloraceae cyanobacterium]|nr:TIGR00645 family protein [Prochloraceae cyanobacterium]
MKVTDKNQSNGKLSGKKIELFVEKAIFNSRWLLTPFYLCFILVILLVFAKFCQEFVKVIPLAISPGDSGEIIIAILDIIDLLLMANLLLIIVFSGYESFVSKFDIGQQEDRPEWMSHITYSSLKIKVIGSIVTISAIDLLRSFINVNEMTNEQLFWRVIIHLTFVVSGVLFAIMDKTIEREH